MQVVIELTDEQWKCVQDGTWCGSKEILNGIPLPKGHGRLIDADKIEQIQNERLQNGEIKIWEQKLITSALDAAETVIEADGGAE